MEKFGTREQSLVVSHGGILTVMRPFLSFSGHFDKIFGEEDQRMTH